MEKTQYKHSVRNEKFKWSPKQFRSVKGFSFFSIKDKWFAQRYHLVQ